MRAFVRYDNKGIIVPTSFVMKKTVPKVGQWKEISTSKSVSGSPAESSQKNLRAFVRYNGKNKVVAGSIVLRGQVPTGNWSELTYDLSRPLGPLGNPAFIITIDTRLGFPVNEFQIGADINYTNNFNIKTSDGQLLEGVSENTTLIFPEEGIYDIEITGEWPKIDFKFIGSGYVDKIINLKNWGNIEFLDMEDAFDSCINMIITATDIPNMSNVTNMNSMFYSCELITSIPNINSWDVSSVQDMEYLFYGCFNLLEVNLSNWNVQNIIGDDGFNEMFEFCRSLVSVNMDNWYLKSSEGVGESIFYSDLNSLTTVSMKNWRLGPDVEWVDRMFGESCPVLTTVDMSGWVLENPTGVRMSRVFTGCTLLTNLKIDIKLRISAKLMFKDCSSLQSYTGTIDVSNVTDMSEMFSDAEAFNQDLSSWAVSNVTDCNNFSANTPSWTLPKPTFTNCTP
jgi:surface protein